MRSIFDVIVFAAGFAACWFGKDFLTSFYKSTEDKIGTLEDKVRALKAKI